MGHASVRDIDSTKYNNHVLCPARLRIPAHFAFWKQVGPLPAVHCKACVLLLVQLKFYSSEDEVLSTFMVCTPVLPRKGVREGMTRERGGERQTSPSLQAEECIMLELAISTVL